MGQISPSLLVVRNVDFGSLMSGAKLARSEKNKQWTLDRLQNNQIIVGACVIILGSISCVYLSKESLLSESMTNS